MKLSLKYLILSVALLSILFTLFSSMNSAYQMSKQTLIDNTLEINKMYAQKLAHSTEVYFHSTFQQLEVSAQVISDFIESDNAEQQLLIEADRLKNQTNTFNSVAIVKANGEIVATSPQTLELVGRMMDSTGGKQALTEKKPIISEPYQSLTGRLIIFISQPIFDESGQYLGLVGGSLYLREKNILYDILGEHYYSDGSYVYVVDKEGNIIYHVDPDRIHDSAIENPVVQKVINQENGAERVFNSKGVDMLAGYAYVPTAGWGIVSQRPTAIAIAPTDDIIGDMLIKALPYLLITIIVIFIISLFIAQPLQSLATLTRSSTEKDQRVKMSKVKAWYFESIQLKKSLINSLGFLHDKVDLMTYQSFTDPLTKLPNRRAVEERIKLWRSEKTAFAVVIIDIDHFKRINDTYGHAMGDEVLIFLANMMKQVVGKADLCSRYGGEEFVLLLHHKNSKEAYEVAEALRADIHHTISPCGDHITISAGIAAYPESHSSISAVFERADQSLYEAKNNGRNRCVIAKTKKVMA